MSNVTELISKVKPGGKTTEFWMALVAQLAGAAMAIFGDQSTAGLVLAGVSTAGYSASRGLAKLAETGPVKRGTRTTEFWISFAAQALGLGLAVFGEQSTAGIVLAAASQGLYQVSRGMAKAGADGSVEAEAAAA